MKYIITGNLVSKANSRRLVVNWKTGRKMFIKSKKALAYEKSFLKQMMQYLSVKCIEKDVRLEALVYYQSRRNDLDCGLLCDCIQKAGLVKNDRQIRQKFLLAEIDRDNPRVEFELFIL